MIFDPILDFFRGKAITIPPMDGALRPNTALDEAAVVEAGGAGQSLLRRQADPLFLGQPRSSP